MTQVAERSVESARSFGLEIHGLTVAFGGNVAVNDVSLSAPRGSITGLIGPNGAGKTTTFNACSGLLKPKKGSIRLFGDDVTTASPGSRARAGLGRTFQKVEVCDSMTVAENVRVGAEARSAGNSPLKQICGSRRETKRIAESAAQALERCHITHLSRKSVASLSTGQRRLIELARVLAGGFPFLLLDEPSSGLDDAETNQFAAILRQAVTELDIGILLVEHDMGLVMGLSNNIYVLDFGQLIFEGSSKEAQDSDVVRNAYLGKDEVEHTR
jgi:ABC-type branched-subunit amino acid transport system ATPase component